jgi:hypothetical protein
MSENPDEDRPRADDAFRDFVVDKLRQIETALAELLELAKQQTGTGRLGH